jgi:glyoxylase-like metal-dependent hydrolase (beta-lactamase superfamily II)
MRSLAGGILQITLPMPSKPGHVHSYLLPGADGWTLVDTGLGLADAQERWSLILDRIDAPVARIFITHFHPDHVGAAADLVELTSATVYESSLDFNQCQQTWSSAARQDILWAWLHENGVPDAEEDEMRSFGEAYQRMTRYAAEPVLVEPGDRIDGWELVAAPGHADGQLMLLKDDILVAGDHLLLRISPAIGLWPDSSDDPLGDYLVALEAVQRVSPRLALPGHGDPIQDPARRAAELIQHHRRRLEQLQSALSDRGQTAYELSFPLFGYELTPAARRFAVTETAAHLERLVREQRAERCDTDGRIAYRRSSKGA